MTEEEELVKLQELQELERLEQMEASETAPQEAPQEAPQVDLIDPIMGTAGGFDIPQELQNPEADQAVQMGAVQGVPFAKDLYTSFQTLAHTGFQDFGENKNKNQMEWEQNYAKMEEKYPNHVMVGDLTTSTIGFSAIPAGVLPMTVYGMFSGASRTPTRDPKEMAVEGAKGGAISLAIPMGLKGLGTAIKGAKGAAKISAGLAAKTPPVQWAAKKLGILSDELTKLSVGGHTSSTLSKVNKHIRKFGTKGLDQQKQTREFVSRITKVEVEGTPLLGNQGVPQNFTETARKAGVAKSSAGAKLNQVVKQIDDVGVEAVDGKVLETELRSRLLNTGKILHRDDAATRAGVEESIRGFFSEKVVTRTPQVLKTPSGILDASGNPVLTDTVQLVNNESFKAIKYTAQNLQKLKLQVSNELRQTDWSKMDKALSQRKLLLKSVRNVADEALVGMEQQASQIEPKLSGLYRKANTHYADMTMVEELTQKAGDGTLNVWSKARGLLAVKGVLAKLPNTSGANKASAIAVTGVLAGAATSAKASPKMQKSLSKVGQFISANPDSEYLKRIIVGATLADRSEDLGETPFKEAVSSVASEITLLESPIKRNLADIKLKSDHILEVMQFHAPVVASSFREALISNDEEGMRSMMDQMSKLPELQDVFEDGKGIDGRVFSEEDKAQLETEVESMDISYIQKLKHKKNLKLNGTIPQIEEEPERFFRPQFRDKSRPKY